MQLAGMEPSPGVNIRAEFPCKSSASPLPFASNRKLEEGGILLRCWLLLNSSLLVTFTRTFPPAASSKGICINKDIFILLREKHNCSFLYPRKRNIAQFTGYGATILYSICWGTSAGSSQDGARG